MSDIAATNLPDVYDMKGAAAYLHMSVKTLRGHCDRNEITYFIVGKRTRRFDRIADLEAFKTRQREKCRSIGPKTRRTTNTTSSSKVIGFTEARRQRRNAKRS